MTTTDKAEKVAASMERVANDIRKAPGRDTPGKPGWAPMDWTLEDVTLDFAQRLEEYAVQLRGAS